MDSYSARRSRRCIWFRLLHPLRNWDPLRNLSPDRARRVPLASCPISVWTFLWSRNQRARWAKVVSNSYKRLGKPKLHKHAWKKDLQRTTHQGPSNQRSDRHQEKFRNLRLAYIGDVREHGYIDIGPHRNIDSTEPRANQASLRSRKRGTTRPSIKLSHGLIFFQIFFNHHISSDIIHMPPRLYYSCIPDY